MAGSTCVFLDACERCCNECIGDGRGISYCIDICGCNCDEFFDDIDCDPDVEDCDEEWEDEGEDYEW